MKTPITAAERKRLADLAGINEQYLYQCLTGRRDMSTEEAVRLERVTSGAIARVDVCQRTFRDRWPELVGAT